MDKGTILMFLRLLASLALLGTMAAALVDQQWRRVCARVSFWFEFKLRKGSKCQSPSSRIRDFSLKNVSTSRPAFSQIKYHRPHNPQHPHLQNFHLEKVSQSRLNVSPFLRFHLSDRLSISSFIYMSFSGNSLNQGARLDHNTFMNNTTNHSRQDRSQQEDSHSPPRRGIVPLSYAYGCVSPSQVVLFINFSISTSAPNLAKSKTSPTHRHPSPTRSNVSSGGRNLSQNAADQDDEAESNISRISAASRTTEPGAVRYARLKQRNQTLGPSIFHPAAPGIILSPPNGTDLRDTSVNVATAFNHAANSAVMSGSEKHRYTAPAPTRRIAAPPSRFNKPLSSASNTSQDDRKARAKSPLLETIANVSQSLARAVSPTSYYLSEPRSEPFLPFRMDEPQPKPPSRQGTKASTIPSNDSYDYEAEEQMMQGEMPSVSTSSSNNTKSKKKSSTMSSSARLSLDNKAYRPSSDEDDDDDFNDSTSRRRRKSKKKDDANRSLTTLPTIGYDKKKRKRKSAAQVEEEMEEEEEEEEDDDDVCDTVSFTIIYDLFKPYIHLTYILGLTIC